MTKEDIQDNRSKLLTLLRDPEFQFDFTRLDRCILGASHQLGLGKTTLHVSDAIGLPFETAYDLFYEPLVHGALLRKDVTREAAIKSLEDAFAEADLPNDSLIMPAMTSNTVQWAWHNYRKSQVTGK